MKIFGRVALSPLLSCWAHGMLQEVSLLQYWGQLIQRAEAPHPLSAREGRLLKRVPLEAQLIQRDLEKGLATAIASRLRHDAAALMVEAWTRGKWPLLLPLDPFV